MRFYPAFLDAWSLSGRLFFLKTTFVAVACVVFIISYNLLQRPVILRQKTDEFQHSSRISADRIDGFLRDQATILMTLARDEGLLAAVRRQNQDLADLSPTDRTLRIDNLNRIWMRADPPDSLVDALMTNATARKLHAHQESTPGRYGEIFLTGRDGLVVGTTGRLTTLAHAHKSWWQRAFAEGRGRVFYDDRGFDESVGDIVLGVVIPIRDGDDVVGILKGNLLIRSELQRIVTSFNHNSPGTLFIMRSGGDIVCAQEMIPLSTRLPTETVTAMRDAHGSGLITLFGQEQIFGSSTIKATVTAADGAFGGTRTSIDHAKGNDGEYWRTVVHLPRSEALADLSATTRVLLITGAVITLILGLTAVLTGRIISRPLCTVLDMIKRWESGDAAARLPADLPAEFGPLTKAFNKMAEVQAYRQQSALDRFEQISHCVTDWIWETDPQWRYTHCSGKLQSVLGYAPEDLLGKTPFDFMDPDEAERVRRIMQEKLEARAPIRNLQTWRQAKDGSAVCLMTSGVPMYDRNGEFLGYRGANSDRTVEVLAQNELETSNHELMQKNRELDEFSYVVSHDLQEPVRKMTTFCGLLEKHAGPDLNDQVKQDLDIIVRASGRMKTLIEDLLILSRSGRIEMNADWVSLDQRLDAVLGDLAEVIAETSPILHREPLPDIHGNATLLGQLLQNLIGNALKFRRPDVQPEIRITAREKESYVVITVADNGIGIEDRFFKNIFLPFKRLHGRQEYPGSGIGLSICQRIVERHQGRIWVESEPDRGTTFLVAFSRYRWPSDDPSGPES